jgi:hypothetical protein
LAAMGVSGEYQLIAVSCERSQQGRFGGVGHSDTNGRRRLGRTSDQRLAGPFEV